MRTQTDPANRGPSVAALIADLETRLKTANSTESASLRAEITELRTDLQQMKAGLIPIVPDPPPPPPPDPGNPSGPSPGDPPLPLAKKAHVLF